MLSRFYGAAMLLCLVASSFAAPVRAQAPATAVPVTVSTCETVPRLNALEVVFHNVSSQTITSARFAVMSASGPLNMTFFDGSFPPGSETRRRNYADLEMQHYQASIECVPTLVQFSDGTSWQNPNVAATMDKALVQTAGSPIVFTACRAVDTLYGTPGIHLTFHNSGTTPLTKVELGLSENGALVWRQSDAGTFSPGIDIIRTYSAESGVVPNDLMHQRCLVLSATFADGTSWSNPDAPVAAAWPPLPAGAATAKAPISVTVCNVGDAYYRNDGTKVVKAADIALVSGGNIVRTLHNLHTLAPGEGIKSSFYTNLKDRLKDWTCVPLRVNFADGTEWLASQ